MAGKSGKWSGPQAEAPNFKHQAPGNIQTSNSKAEDGFHRLDPPSPSRLWRDESGGVWGGIADGRSPIAKPGGGSKARLALIRLDWARSAVAFWALARQVRLRLGRWRMQNSRSPIADSRGGAKARLALIGLDWARSAVALWALARQVRRRLGRWRVQNS